MSDVAATTPSSVPAQPSVVCPKTAERAVTGLLKWREAKSKTEKPKLLEHDEFIYLIVTLKKIPQKRRMNPHKILLPHALMNPVEDSSELCLIIDDRPKSQLTKDAAMKKIKSENIPISKVIKLSKLRTDYRPFEAKRKLCDSYDMFFADRRVIPLLPRLLGKQFFKKKKIPVAIDLKHKNWKEQIEKACGAALFYVRTGTCSVVKVGKLSMGSKEIAENLMAAVKGITDIVPSKWKNIRSFHLKLLDSLALPIYQTVPDLKLKIEASVNDNDVKESEGEELGNSDVDGDKSNENASIKKKKKKGRRIHEVRYMDSDVLELLGEEEIGLDDENDVVDNEENDKHEMGNVENEGKKRKKLDKAKSEKPAKKLAKAKSEKPAKKLAKVKKSDGVEQTPKSKDGVKLQKQNKVREESGELKEKAKKKKSTLKG